MSISEVEEEEEEDLTGFLLFCVVGSYLGSFFGFSMITSDSEDEVGEEAEDFLSRTSQLAGVFFGLDSSSEGDEEDFLRTLCLGGVFCTVDGGGSSSAEELEMEDSSEEVDELDFLADVFFCLVSVTTSFV